MRFWTFWDCLTESGRNVIRDWIAGLPQGTKQQVKARLTALLLELEQVEGPFDRARGVGQLRGDPCKGLYEILLRVDRTQFRVIGCYGPQLRGEFTLLMGAVEKGNRFTNPEVCRIGQERRTRIQDRRFIIEHAYD